MAKLSVMSPMDGEAYPLNEGPELGKAPILMHPAHFNTIKNAVVQ
jgi:hypothetical protein